MFNHDDIVIHLIYIYIYTVATLSSSPCGHLPQYLQLSTTASSHDFQVQIFCRLHQTPAGRAGSTTYLCDRVDPTPMGFYHIIGDGKLNPIVGVKIGPHYKDSY